MNHQHEQALYLYLHCGYRQNKIAETLGVSERTIYNWIHKNGWHRLKQAAMAAPVVLAENICNQVAELQGAVAARPEGQRYPTLPEAEITRKLVTCFNALQKHPSLNLAAQVMTAFREHVREKEKDEPALKALGNHIRSFLTDECRTGLRPYQTAYETHMPLPVDPFYGDTEEPLATAENRAGSTDTQPPVEIMADRDVPVPTTALSGIEPKEESRGNLPEIPAGKQQASVAATTAQPPQAAAVARTRPLYNPLPIDLKNYQPGDFYRSFFPETHQSQKTEHGKTQNTDNQRKHLNRTGKKPESLQQQPGTISERTLSSSWLGRQQMKLPGNNG